VHGYALSSEKAQSVSYKNGGTIYATDIANKVMLPCG